MCLMFSLSDKNCRDMYLVVFQFAVQAVSPPDQSSRLLSNPCLCLFLGFTAQSTKWYHVERGQFT